MLSLQNKEIGVRNNDGKNVLQNSQNIQLNLNSHSELKEVYMCSCGKQYQSFPATYLHFRTKHDIKLSTKSSEKRKLITIEGDIKKITYLVDLNLELNEDEPLSNSISENKEITLQSSDIQQKVRIIQSCISKYSNVIKQFDRILYQKLSQFFDQLKFKEALKKLAPSVDKIPYFLNQFTLYYLPNSENSFKVGSRQWKQTCKQLLRFCNWLRQEKYTDLIVIYQNQ